MENRIISVMASVLGVNQSTINDDTSPDTIEGWDSLKHLNLVVAIEEEFNINLSSEEVGEMMNYKLIRLIIKEKINLI